MRSSQESSDRLQAFECKDSEEQLSLLFAERYILGVRKFQM